MKEVKKYDYIYKMASSTTFQVLQDLVKNSKWKVLMFDWLLLVGS